MSYPRTRGISLVRTIKVTKPNRKEPEFIQKQFMVRCNASIPMDHKNFQNQYLYEDGVPEQHLPKPVQKKPQEKGKKKLDKWKKNLL